MYVLTSFWFNYNLQYTTNIKEYTRSELAVKYTSTSYDQSKGNEEVYVKILNRIISLIIMYV